MTPVRSRVYESTGDNLWIDVLDSIKGVVMISYIHVPRNRLLTVRQIVRMFNVDEDTVNAWSQHGLVKRFTTTTSGFCYLETDIRSVVDGVTQDQSVRADR